MNYKNVLVPTDLSPRSEAALKAAVDICQTCSARLHLLLAYDRGYAGGPKGEISIPNDFWGTNKAGAKLALNNIAETANAEGGFELSTHLAEGEPELAIVALAKRIPIDLIIMGTKGRTGLSHVFIGSVTERTIRLSPCPVMVVKDKVADEEFETHYANELPRRPWVDD